MNRDGQYNTATGNYTCEKSGVYYFTYSIYGTRIQDGSGYSLATASLMKEGLEQCEAYVSNFNTESIFITLSQSLVLQCNAGEKVWVQSTWNNNFIAGKSDSNIFAGILLSMN